MIDNGEGRAFLNDLAYQEAAENQQRRFIDDLLLASELPEKEKMSKLLNTVFRKGYCAGVKHFADNRDEWLAGKQKAALTENKLYVHTAKDDFT